jgi:hypothetical protein
MALSPWHDAADGVLIYGDDRILLTELGFKQKNPLKNIEGFSMKTLHDLMRQFLV